MLSLAAAAPISGLAPAPKPRVTFTPSWILCAAREPSRACASVLHTRNSQPSRPEPIMLFTAFPPAPPTPMTVIFGFKRLFAACILTLSVMFFPSLLLLTTGVILSAYAYRFQSRHAFYCIFFIAESTLSYCEIKTIFSVKTEKVKSLNRLPVLLQPMGDLFKCIARKQHRQVKTRCFIENRNFIAMFGRVMQQSSTGRKRRPRS